MKARTSFLLILAVGSGLALTWAVAARGSALDQRSVSTQTASPPHTLNLNLAGEPFTLDPAWVTDSISINVVEQLFIGLVDLDDETGEIRPELATRWTVSVDRTVYTFTLRNDVTWSDGNPVVAEDVRYGILRTLDPATQSAWAYPLTSIIKNAGAYNDGAITDPDQVGVTAVNHTTLRVTLEYPASYVLSILAMWIARPMPQWAIEAHGVPTWTEPAHIVTNGPYRLAEWAHDDHILLEKKPTYYDAVNVQIARVKMWIVDIDTAGQMYLNNQLDIVTVPYTINTPLDPLLRRELHIQPVPCTYYYGFSTSLEPFDNPLVRKAFIAATNRQGLIENVTRGFEQPALTFTSPGVFGYVDGYAEGIGIPYDPAQAQQWLAAAGYPNGQGLPPITLWFNSSYGHEAIAEYVRDNWYTTLGVSVTLQSLPWQEYSDVIGEGEFQVWRFAWCRDYRNAHNFLSDAILHNRGGRFGNWTNSTYDSLVSYAAWEQDPDVRKALYKQAEEILAETDAVIIPLYFYADGVATRPYLERTCWIGDECDIAAWRFAWRVYLPLVLRNY